MTSVVDALCHCNGSFFHAINLNDFMAYAERDELLPREQLEPTGKMTPFGTDWMDKKLGLYGHLFGNLVDYGNFFASRPYQSTPNVYGPIVLHYFWRDIYEGVSDLAITKEGVATEGYNRAEWALDADSVEAAFKNKERGWVNAVAGRWEVSFKHEGLKISATSEILVDAIQHDRDLLGAADLREVGLLNWFKGLPTSRQPNVKQWIKYIKPGTLDVLRN